MGTKRLIKENRIKFNYEGEERGVEGGGGVDCRMQLCQILGERFINVWLTSPVLYPTKALPDFLV